MSGRTTAENRKGVLQLIAIAALAFASFMLVAKPATAAPKDPIEGVETTLKVKNKVAKALSSENVKVKPKGEARSSKKKGGARKMPKGERARKKWEEEIRQRPASPPGTPPFTHTGALKAAILFAYDPSHQSVVVGPSRTRLGNIAHLHEFGGRRKGKTYPARPFMRPALERTKPKLPGFWRNSIR